MEVNITVEAILQPREYKKKDGTAGLEFSFVGKTMTGQYDKQLKFDVFNQENWVQMALQVGRPYTVYFDVSSRPWNSPTKGEMWFTSLLAWKAEPMAQTVAAPQPVQQPQPQPLPPQAAASNYELPF